MFEPRNLMQGWCPVGSSLGLALATLGPSHVMAVEAEINSWPASEKDERRAAWYLAAHTGRLPVLRDQRMSGAGLVDLVLKRDGSAEEVAEVMSTIDQDFMRNADHLRRRVVAGVSGEYGGSNAWGLDFERGIVLPRGTKLKSASIAWAATLLAADADPSNRRIEIAEGVSGYRLPTEHPRGVYFAGMNAEVPENGGEPYLDRLSSYLASDEKIREHIVKLVREGRTLNAKRRHLYLLMASTGQNGGLLSPSPSYFTWGTFTAPDGVTDLWIDASGANIFHWSKEIGWVYHPGRDQ